MSVNKPYGTAFTGILSLTNGAPGPLAIVIHTVPGGAAYVLGATERMYVTGVALSSNDTAIPLVAVDIGVGTYSVVSAYVGSTIPAYVDNFVSPPIIGKPGVAFRASAPSITAAKTIEVKIVGYISIT